VAFDRPLPGASTDCVLVENRYGAEEATQHLIDHGHRAIVCVGYDEDTYTVSERVKGYVQQMSSAGLKPQLAFGLVTLDEVREWLRKVWLSKDRPTAIFSINHRTSASLLQALAEQAIRIPGDIALLGFDDFDLAAVVSPALTTIAQSPVDLARRSMGLLLERLDAPADGPPSASAKILLPVQLVVRASCGSHN